MMAAMRPRRFRRWRMSCRPLRRDMRWLRSGRRGVAEGGDDGIDDLLDHDGIVAFAHHPSDRFGAGRTDQQPPVSVETFLAGIDRRLDLDVVERLAGAI